MSASHMNQDKSIFLRVTVALVFLFGAFLFCASSYEITPDDDLRVTEWLNELVAAQKNIQSTEWLNQLVTAQKNISTSQILGQWYTVEQVRSYSYLPWGYCEKFDFFLSNDNISYLVNHTITGESGPFLPLEVSVVSNATWVLRHLTNGYKVVDISTDGGFLALASCSQFTSYDTNNCLGAVLARNPDLSGRDEDLLVMHRSLTHAGVNDTRVGYRQPSEPCRPGASVESQKPVAHYYDV